MLKVQSGGLDLTVKQWRFPCGEAGFKIESAPSLIEFQDVWIHLHWEGNDDLMALAQAVDAVRHAGAKRIFLRMPYFPYSRQDRRCNPGEGHALKMVAQFINSLDFEFVETYDAHSTVLEAVVDRLNVMPQAECAIRLPIHDILIAPDAGAAKKVFKHGQVVNGMAEALVADKVRGERGVILSTRIYDASKVKGKRVCVVDDLCDGGATFIELAKVLWANDPAELNLYVTHGFFTKGADVLLPYYDNIYVANLMNENARNQVKEI
jgi:ribose-phosphate pyrophosphokinase